jgi:hypothetical protein
VSAADEAPRDQAAESAAATPDPSAAVSQEFFLRVNDFLQMANRIERRYDTHHAQLAFMHAFSRYSAHHFNTTTSIDDAENRDAFADYIGENVKELIRGHIQDMVGAPTGARGTAAAATPAADEGAAPAAPADAPADEA